MVKRTFQITKLVNNTKIYSVTVELPINNKKKKHIKKY